MGVKHRYIGLWRMKINSFMTCLNLVNIRRETQCTISDEHIQRYEQGGTTSMAFGRLSSYVTETGVDSKNLGRWGISSDRKS